MTAAEPAPRPRRRWLRWILWPLAVLLVLRIGLTFGAGPLVRRLAAQRGIALDFEDLELELFRGRFEAWRLVAAIRDPSGAERPLASVQTLALDLDVLALLRGHVRVRRLELDGGRIELACDAAGEWNLAPLLVADDGPADEPEPDEPYEPRPLVLEPPIEVVAARVQDLTVHLVDESSTPALDATLTVSLTASDVGSPGRNARLDVVATSPEIVDLLRVSGTGTVEGAAAELEFGVDLSGLRPRPLASLLATLGIEPLVDRMDGALALTLSTLPATELGDRIRVRADLRDVALVGDGRETLAIDLLEAEVAEAWPRGAHAVRVDLHGVRARTARTKDGAPVLAGLAFRGRPAQAAEEPAAAATTAAAPPAEPLEWSIGSLRVLRSELVHEDASTTPPVVTTAQLEEVTLGPLSSRADAPAAHLELAARVPGVLERIALSGSVHPGAGAFDLALDADGLDLAPLEPYLVRAGLGAALEDGTLRVESLALGPAEGGQSLVLRGLAAQGGGVELGAIGSLVLDFRAGRLAHVGLTGARLDTTREASGAFVLLGLRFGAPDGRAPTPAEEAPVAADVPAAPPTFTLPALDLPEVELELERLALTDAETGVREEVGPLTAALTSVAPSGDRVRAHRLALDGKVQLARELHAELVLEQAGSGDLALRASARARDLVLEKLRPLLALAGLEPALDAGALDAELTLALAARDGRPVLDLQLGPLAFADGGEERFALERLALEGLVLGPVPEIAALRITAPRLHVRRDADGGFHALGLRVPPPVEPGAPGEMPATLPETPPAAEPALGAAVEASADRSDAERTPPLRLGRFELAGAKFTFEDHAGVATAERALPFRVELGADVSLADLAPGTGAPPSALEASLRLGATELSASGTVVLDPADLSASLALAGERLSGADVAPYLPPGIAVTLADGVARGRVEARVARASGGGHAMSLQLADLDLRERDAERPLAALASARLDAPRLDPVAGVYDVAELTVAGAHLDVVRATDGVAALGLLFAQPAAEAEAVPDAEPAPEAGAVPESGKAVREIGASRAAPERLRLGKLDIDLTELLVTSNAGTPSRSSARLALRAPFELDLTAEGTDEESPEPPPLALDLTASVAGGIESLALALDLAPFAELPRIDAVLAVRGIEGAGLLALAPELTALVDASGMTAGTFDATLGAEVSWRRRGRFDFDVRGGFGAEVLVSDVALRRSADGPIELGVDRVEALVRRVVPHTGAVHVASLDVDTPRARVRRVANGLDVAGIVLLQPAEAAAPADAAAPAAESEPAPPADIAPVTPRASDALAASGARGEQRLDSLVVHGIDVVYEDVTTAPPMVLPLERLELELRGLSSRTLSEPVPLRISASLGAGDVSLPERLESSSMLLGIASSGLRALGGEKKEALRYEMRPFFQDASLMGRVSLAPSPRGWLRGSLAGFELVGLRGPALQSGVEIGDGLLDLGMRLRFEEEKSHFEMNSNFAHLSLSEPPGGPISRYLRLPAPLDTVLFALANEQGDHRIPLSFDVESTGGIDGGAIALSASKALLGLITEALAGAPLRAVSGVTGLGGLFRSDDDGKPEHAGMTATIHFAPGAVRLGPGEKRQLEDIVEAMKEDDLLELQVGHVFGPGDLERAELLASPDSDEATVLLRALRLRRAELVRRRDELSAVARTQLLLGETTRFAEAREELLLVDRDLGLSENGIDRVAELLRQGAESHRDRRTRDAALAIARTRLDVLLRQLLDDGVSFERTSLRPPRLEIPEGEETNEHAGGRIELITRGGTPKKGFFRRVLGWLWPF